MSHEDRWLIEDTQCSSVTRVTNPGQRPTDPVPRDTPYPLQTLEFRDSPSKCKCITHPPKLRVQEATPTCTWSAESTPAGSGGFKLSPSTRETQHFRIPCTSQKERASWFGRKLSNLARVLTLHNRRVPAGSHNLVYGTSNSDQGNMVSADTDPHYPGRTFPV